MSQCYSARKRARVEAGCAKLLHMLREHKKQRIFRAWVDDYKEVRRAKRWFNQKKEGEEGGGEEEWHWPEGEDYISTLPREVAVKVSGEGGRERGSLLLSSLLKDLFLTL